MVFRKLSKCSFINKIKSFFKRETLDEYVESELLSEPELKIDTSSDLIDKLLKDDASRRNIRYDPLDSSEDIWIPVKSTEEYNKPHPIFNDENYLLKEEPLEKAIREAHESFRSMNNGTWKPKPGNPFYKNWEKNNLNNPKK